MPIFLEKPNGPDTIEVEEIMISLEDGTVLRGSMLLDKEGNETETLFDAITVLARSEDYIWYEIYIKEGSWIRPFLH